MGIFKNVLYRDKKFKFYIVISYNSYFPSQNNDIIFNQITKIHVFDRNITLN